MRQIRKSHTNEIIDRRLRDCETSDRVDAMELIGLHDEIARVERKWLENAERIRSGQPNRRPLGEWDILNARFDRLTRLIDAALRKGVAEPAERQMLQDILGSLRSRKPLTV